MREKVCAGCGSLKPLDLFGADRKSKDGHESRCKKCRNLAQRTYREKNKEALRERDREYRLKNKEKVSARKAKYRAENKEKIREYNKKHNARYKKEHQEEILKLQAEYREKNRETLREKERERKKNNPDVARKGYLKWRANPRNRIRDSISRAINYSLKGSPKGGRWDRLVGYSVEDLRRHLEKQFLPGMTWENYGTHGWHIDHIIPVSAFNYASPKHIDFKRCWALKNLRPMWASENISKKNKLSKPFQPSLQLQEAIMKDITRWLPLSDILDLIGGE